jgi:hypothetical protein
MGRKYTYAKKTDLEKLVARMQAIGGNLRTKLGHGQLASAS